MAKKLLFFSIFTCFQVLAFAFRTDGFKPQPSANRSGDYCDAPAPDNFSVTGMASDLVTLGWDPAMPGAMHTLELLVEENGAWKSLWINPEVPGDAIVLDNLEPGNYLARLATNCETGEVSLISVELSFEFKIIDLVVVGKIPKNPILAENCDQILFWKHNWVGFKILEKETNKFNVFEVDIKVSNWSEHVFVRRLYNNSIVAVNDLGIFPVNPNQQITVNSPIKIHDIENPNNEVGHIILERILPFPNPLVLKMCNLIDDSNKPWNGQYDFIPLVADETLDEIPTGGSTDNNLIQDANDILEVQNPVVDKIRIKLSKNIIENGYLHLEVFDVNMKLVKRHYVTVLGTHLEIPFEMQTPGIYFLRINTKIAFKLIKIN